MEPECFSIHSAALLFLNKTAGPAAGDITHGLCSAFCIAMDIKGKSGREEWLDESHFLSLTSCVMSSISNWLQETAVQWRPKWCDTVFGKASKQKTLLILQYLFNKELWNNGSNLEPEPDCYFMLNARIHSCSLLVASSKPFKTTQFKQ